MNITYSKFRYAYLLIAFLFFSHIFIGFRSAPPIGRTGAPGDGVCTSCHGGTNPEGLDGTVQILNLPTEVMPNTTYRVTVEVANPNGLSQVAGMQMVALGSDNNNAGSFTNPSAGGNVVVSNGRNYLGHSPAQAYDANRIASWEVDWTSPASPDPNVTFYAVGNITDSNPGSNTANDLIMFETQNTAVVEDVVVELPDLTASNVNGFAGTFAPDEVVEFTWDLNNLGNAIAVDGYRIVMYLSEDNIFSADDVAVGEVPTGNTFPGTIPNVPGAIRIPVDAVDGDYYLHLFVDNDNAIEESDESNNVLTNSTTITVETFVPEPLVLTITQTFDCAGFSTLTSEVEGGVPPYSYEWSTGETTPSIIVDENALYALTVTDDTGVNVTAFENVSNPEILIAEVQILEQAQCGDGGQVEIIVTGGSGDFSFAWSNGADVSLQDNLAAGDYSNTVTDLATGCFVTQDFSLDSQDDFEVETTISQLTCHDANDAAISLEVIGAIDVTYVWSTGAETSSISNLLAGSYSVTVTASADCVYMNTFIITEINPIEVISEIQDVACSGDFDGAINALAIGGTGPYTYAWSNGEMTSNIVSLSAGVYTLTVTDMNDCELEQSFTIEEPDPFILSIETEDVSCFGASDGSIRTTVTGGVAPFTFEWDVYNIGSGFESLPAGTYNLTLTDANACSAMASVVIEQPDEIIIDAELSFLDTGASIDLTVTGGTGDYVFTWSNGFSTEDQTNLPDGFYTVVVTDENDCIASRDFEIITSSAHQIESIATWELYPTIVEDHLTIEVQLTEPLDLQVQLAGLHGAFVTAPNDGFSSTGLVQKAELDVSNLEAGIYLLILDSEQGREVRKFVKH